MPRSESGSATLDIYTRILLLFLWKSREGVKDQPHGISRTPQVSNLSGILQGFSGLQFWKSFHEGKPKHDGPLSDGDHNFPHLPFVYILIHEPPSPKHPPLHTNSSTNRFPSAAAARSSCLSVGKCLGFSNLCAAGQDVPNALARSASGLSPLANLTNRAAWMFESGAAWWMFSPDTSVGRGTSCP